MKTSILTLLAVLGLTVGSTLWADEKPVTNVNQEIKQETQVIKSDRAKLRSDRKTMRKLKRQRHHKVEKTTENKTEIK